MSISKMASITLAANRLDRNPSQRQIVSKLMVVDVEVNEIAQPLRRNFHRLLAVARTLLAAKACVSLVYLRVR